MNSRLLLILFVASIFALVGCASKRSNETHSAAVQTAALASATPKRIPSRCHGYRMPPPLVIMTWDLGSGGAKSRRDSTSATAILRNNTKEELEIDLSAHYYLDELHAKQNLVTLLLAPEEQRSVEIDLRPTKKTSLAELQFSGQVNLEAKAKTRSGDIRTNYSDNLFFHQEGRDLIIYNEDTLKKTFGAGDFRGKLKAADMIDKETELAGVAVARLMSDEEVKQSRINAGPPRPQGTF